MNRLMLISADCHAGLPPERYRDYLDPQYRELFDQALPVQLDEMEKKYAEFLAEGFRDDWKAAAGKGYTGAWDSDERNRQLDADGIAGEIIFCDGVTEMNAPPFGAGLAPADDLPGELHWAGARAHNRWLAELCSQAPERRAGLAVVPIIFEIEDAVREVRWAREAGLRGVMIPAMWGTRPPYHDPRYEPFWAACEELDMPIHVHGGAAPDYGEHPGHLGIFITEVAWWSARPAWFLIWSGVFERHPRLKFVITELGANWVPELKALMDQRFEHNHFTAKLAEYRQHMKMKPSEYFDRNCFIGASVTSRSDIELRHEIGLPNMMWGSDFPHPEGAWPQTRRFLKESFHGIPEKDARMILGENAARVYGFDAEKLAPLVERIGPRLQDL